MTSSATNATGDAAPGVTDDVGIPNVADTSTRRFSKKSVLMAVGALAVVLAASAAAAYKMSQRDRAQAEKKDTGPKPIIATAPPRKEFAATPLAAMLLPMAASAPQTAGSNPAKTNYAVPKVESHGLDDPDAAKPIPVVGAGNASRGATGTAAGKPTIAPEDAPMMLAAARQATRAGEAGVTDEAQRVDAAGGDEVAQARQRLRGYQQQLGTLVSNLSRVANQTAGGNAATGAGAPYNAPLAALPVALTGTAPPTGPGERVLGLEKSNTPTVRAGQLRDRSLVMPKGTAFTCSLKTRVISAVSGMVSCIIARNVYSDDGRVLLVERGSHMDGEYRVASVKPGMTRIPVLWTRIRTPNGITVDLDSPGTGALGESGIDGHVDNRWPERIGAALLLSFIDDLVRIEIAQQQSGATTVYGSTTKESSKLAEKVLESTINIPPLIYQNQGATVGVYVARDVDFSSVYALRPAAAP